MISKNGITLLISSISILLINAGYAQNVDQKPNFVQPGIALQQGQTILNQLKNRNADQYPFNSKVALGLSYDLQQISQRMIEIIDTSSQDPKELTNVVTSIQQTYRGRNEKYPVAVMNYYALQEAEPEVDCDMLLASFVISNQQKIVGNIEVLLEYSSIFVGDDELALRHRAANAAHLVSFQTDEETNHTLLHHWPAAHAILNNPEQSLPLLMDALQNEKLEERLRLKAAAFIHQISSDDLSKIIVNLESDFAGKATCVQIGNLDWKVITSDVCGLLHKQNERLESRVKRQR